MLLHLNFPTAGQQIKWNRTSSTNQSHQSPWKNGGRICWQDNNWLFSATDLVFQKSSKRKAVAERKIKGSSHLQFAVCHLETQQICGQKWLKCGFLGKTLSIEKHWMCYQLNFLVVVSFSSSIKDAYRVNRKADGANKAVVEENLLKIEVKRSSPSSQMEPELFSEEECAEISDLWMYKVGKNRAAFFLRV